jgi:hypothetical protein
MSGLVGRVNKCYLSAVAASAPVLKKIPNKKGMSFSFPSNGKTRLVPHLEVSETGGEGENTAKS